MAEQAPFRGFQNPNYTQVPDQMFDELLSTLSGAELKVLLYIIRRTFGFKKTSDNISLSQLTDGIVTNTGKRIDSGTGLVKSTAAVALKGLLEKNIILKVRNQAPGRGDMATTYALNLITTPVQKSDPLVSENQTPPTQKIGHPEGQKSDTQETVTNKQTYKVVNDVTANDHGSSGTGTRTPTSRKIPTISDRALRATYHLADDQLGRVHWLVEKQVEILGAGDRNHGGYVKRAAEAVRDGAADLLDATLGEFKQAETEINVGSRPAYFHAMWNDVIKLRTSPNTPKPSATSEHTHHGQSTTMSTAFGPARDAQESHDQDPRVRLITDAERRGYRVPDHIRTADVRAVNHWWASLTETSPNTP